MSKSLHTLSPEQSAWLADRFAHNRATFGGWHMEGDGGDGGGDGGSDGGDGGAQTFTQADVDAAVEKVAAKIRADERRKVSEKFADYDDLKAKADGAKTLEDRVAEIERQAKKSETRALRAEVANAKGLTPSQAKRLIGSTREELEADADELLQDIGTSESDRKRQGNRVPGEGRNHAAKASDERETVRALFGSGG